MFYRRGAESAERSIILLYYFKKEQAHSQHVSVLVLVSAYGFTVSL